MGAYMRLGLLVAVVAVSILALAGVWLGSGEKGAGADPATIVGIDMDFSGNAANALGTVDDCTEKSPGDKFYIDVFVDEIPAGSRLSRFGYSLEFDDSRLKIDTQDHLWLLNLAVGSLVTDESEPVPDVTSPHDVYAIDYQGPEGGPVKGVLGRYQVEVLAGASSGLASLSPSYLYLGDPTGTPVPWDVVHLSSGVTAIGVPCPTQTPAPSPTVTPTPMLTLTPAVTPKLMPTPETPTPKVTPTAALPATVTPSPAAPEATPTPAATPVIIPTVTPVRPPPSGADGVSGSSSGLPLWAMALASWSGLAIVAGLGTLVAAKRG